ncbi:MAG TPA: transposase, partial [Myxococcaceae bacterium]
MRSPVTTCGALRSPPSRSRAPSRSRRARPDGPSCRSSLPGQLRTRTGHGEQLHRFSMGRASKTPKEVLGGTTGALVVDAYTGYNAVTVPQGRVRVGCW